VHHAKSSDASRRPSRPPPPTPKQRRSKAVAIASSPFVLKDVSLTLVKTGEAGTPVEYRCQLSQAQLTPSAGAGATGATMETFCAVYDSSGTSASSWVLDLAGFQAYGDVTDFSMISFNEEGEQFDFVLMPLGGVASATNPGFEGTVTMVATPIGGTANQYAQFTGSLPCTEKPTMVVA
jgi:hypothetical protein